MQMARNIGLIVQTATGGAFRASQFGRKVQQPEPLKVKCRSRKEDGSYSCSSSSSCKGSSKGCQGVLKCKILDWVKVQPETQPSITPTFICYICRSLAWLGGNLQITTRSLRSSGQGSAVVPRTRLQTKGHRASEVVAPAPWIVSIGASVGLAFWPGM